MAERGGSNKPDLSADAAAPDPGESPDTIAIYGILGKSGIASSVRLYLDRGLSTYYDIPIEGIVGREKVPADRSPLGVDSTELFVRKGIRLVVHHADTRTVEEEFVSGDFTAPGSFVPSAPQAMSPTTTITIRPTLGFTCTYVPPQCPGGLGGNGSAPPNCPTVQVCHTQPRFGCPRSAPPYCPSVQPCRTQPNFCLSAPPHCPSVQLCTRPLSAPPHCPSVQPCHTQPNFCLSAPPHCPTVQTCPPPLSAPPRCPTVQVCEPTVLHCASFDNICS